MRLSFKISALLLTAAALMLPNPPGFGQTTNIVVLTNASTNTIPLPINSNRLSLRAGQLLMRTAPQGATTAPDPMNSLMASASAYDTDSPPEARAEFDPPVVPFGGRVLYRLTVTALDESLKIPDTLPAPRGLELHVGGRGQSYQSAGNGKLRPQTTVIFHVTVATNGTFTIPSFDVTAYGKPVKVPEATVSVVPPGTTPSREPPRLIMEMPEGDIYVGQPLKIPIVLPVPPDGSMQMMYQARITGDFVFSEQGLGPHQETIKRDGKSIPAFVQEVLITPLREGPQEWVAQAQGIANRPIAGMPNQFQSAYTLIDSEPLAITIKPLPKEGRLPGFTGAIGSFQLDPPRLSTNELRAGEPVTLTITMHGDWNVGRFSMPLLPLLRDWQTFPPIGENLPPAFLQQQRGQNTFTYTLIPLSDRVKATPAIPLCYFDPAQKAYVDITIPPLAVTVKPGAPSATVDAAQPADNSGSGSDDASTHERELAMTGLAETPGRTVANLAPIQRQWWFLGLQLVPAVALFGLWGWDRRRRHLEQHPEVLLKRQARQGLRRQLGLARRAATARDAAAFINGAANAFREACAPHGAANPDALVCADVLQELPVPDRTGPRGEVVRRVFSAADALRFGGPVKDAPELLALESEVESVLQQLRSRL